MGIGFIIVVPADEVDAALDILKIFDYKSSVIGEVTAEAGIKING
jgi:phosphoribosylformylglycinamidine cyclo-ligase